MENWSVLAMVFFSINFQAAESSAAEDRAAAKTLKARMTCLLVGRLPWWLRGRASACKAGDPGLIRGSGGSPGEGNGNPLQYSCLENSVGYNPWGRKE